MANWKEPVLFGRSGLRVGRLGIGASYGAPAAAIEAAFERGVNYLYWGTSRRGEMARAIRNIAKKNRDGLVVTIQSYSRSALLMRASLELAIRRLGLDHADVLLLGWWPSLPPARILDEAVRLREKGRVRALAISSHNRPLFSQLAALGIFDALMVRYNAAHRGAEADVFPRLPTGSGSPAVIAYTATRWRSLLDPRRAPPGEKTPTAGDCYRFALSHPRVGMVLTGPANAAQMDEALRALDRGPLGDDEMAWIRRVGDHVYQARKGFQEIAFGERAERST